MANTHYSKLVAKFEGRTTAPSEPQVGQVYYDTDNEILRVYIDSAWYGVQFS